MPAFKFFNKTMKTKRLQKCVSYSAMVVFQKWSLPTKRFFRSSRFIIARITANWLKRARRWRLLQKRSIAAFYSFGDGGPRSEHPGKRLGLYQAEWQDYRSSMIYWTRTFSRLKWMNPSTPGQQNWAPANLSNSTIVVYEEMFSGCGCLINLWWTTSSGSILKKKSHTIRYGGPAESSALNNNTRPQLEILKKHVNKWKPKKAILSFCWKFFVINYCWFNWLNCGHFKYFYIISVLLKYLKKVGELFRQPVICVNAKIVEVFF